VKILKLAIACTFFSATSSFAEPVPIPASKMAYIGTWQGTDMNLTIAPDGKIAYKRAYSNKKHVDLSIELVRFNGDNFDAGVGIFNSTFVVSRPPVESKGKTTMVVDGIELTKKN
jgi:hypothetical protein